MKHCLKCGFEVEEDDNFCPECGYWTTKGYTFLKDENNKKILDGVVVKKNNKLSTLFIIMFIFILVFISTCYIRGNDIFRPVTYIKHKVLEKRYGYNTTIINNNNQYFKKKINSKEEALSFIEKDLSKQEWECYNGLDVGMIEEKIENDYDITSVTFCEISLDEIKKIQTTIDEVYNIFPNIKGYLTNITLTNASDSESFVAYFQPIYQFVNSTNDINEYNKVNKTQILLNTNYFLNHENMKNSIPDNWYVKDATYESLIAHEFGHYITFVSLLKSKNIDNVTYITKSNYSEVDNLMDIINNETYSKELVNQALNNYNSKYETDINVLDFSNMVSNYASSKNSNGNIVYDEIIAEAFHDYFLHKENSSLASLEIINVLNSRL